MSEYDISRAFKRIENDLMDSMMRNLKRHQAEETDLGIEWEQWQALQLKELERYRKQNADKFTDDFDQINRKVDAMFRATCNDAQSKQENYLLEQIKKGDFTPTQTKDTQFFNLNDAKLNILIERTKADFTRAEYAMLRKADDAYRKVIFDAQVYASVTNDYAKAVDMATHDFLMKGIQCVQYSNGAKHTLENYAEMCVRTGNKRAYLMGEGNAHDKYGIHTVRVNKRTQACPKCVKFLGRVLIDDVYSGGTAKEASDLGVPTLSSAIQAGFLHPNCKDIYSLYIPNVSKPATPWTQSEINDIVGDYNQEQELQHANDMVESYARLAKYALDPENQKTYRARAQAWDKRAIEIENGTTPVPAQPQVFTDDEKEALEWYVSGDGMWINQYLRDPSAFGELNDTENQLLGLLESATEKELEPIDTLYRSVDAKVIFEGLDEAEIEQMMNHLYYGDSTYDKGAFSQNIKKRMEKALSDAKGKTLTEKGFMSTTVDKKVAERFGDFTGAEHPVVIELDTKGKKIKGADVDFLDIEEDPQRERILAKNTRYKINDIVVETDADGARYIKVKAELVDQGAEVAEEATEEVAKEAVKATEKTDILQEVEDKEAEIRARLAEAKTRRLVIQKEVDDYTVELNKIKSAKTYYDTQIAWRGRERIQSLREHYTKYPQYYKAESEWLDFIEANYDEIEANGIDNLKAPVEEKLKAVKKQLKPIDKELDTQYKELEAIIGTPNTTKLDVYGNKNTKQIAHLLDDAPEELRGVWNQCADNFNPLGSKDRFGRRRKGAYYTSSEDGVYLSINSASKGNDYETPYQVVFHEYGHNIDYVLNRVYGNGDRHTAFSTTYKDGIFGKTLAEEAEEAILNFGKENGFVGLPNKGKVMQDAESMVRRGLIRADEKTEWIRRQLQIETVDRLGAEKAFCEHMKKEYGMSARADVSDMFEPVMEDPKNAYPFGFGHGIGYWTKDGAKYRRHGKEAFAEMYSAMIANEDSWEVINKFFPRSVQIFNEILEVTKL